MKLNDKVHWDGFIYGLIYPGFVGSMIYELIPANAEEAKISNYFTVVTGIKIIITLFYATDYLHLYGDIHPRVKVEERSATYLWCDVASSLFFFFAFVSVKLGHYEWALWLMAILPIWFTIYKWKNEFDKPFNIIYLGLSVLSCVFIASNDTTTLILFCGASFLIYLGYVFYFFDKYSVKGTY